MKALPWVLLGAAVLVGGFLFLRSRGVQLVPSSAPTYAPPPVVVNTPATGAADIAKEFFGEGGGFGSLLSLGSSVLDTFYGGAEAVKS